MKLRERFWKFWSERNGADQFYQFLMWLLLVLMLINLFVGSLIFSLVILALLCYATFRLLSRNRYRRQRENQAYLHLLSRIKGWFVLNKNKVRDRKTHIYRKCPSCRRVLRLPRIKGTHTVCCPCCGNRFQTKV